MIEERRELGVYASCIYNERSLQELDNWLKLINVPNPVPIDKVHTTVVYSRKNFDLPKDEEIALLGFNNQIQFKPKEFRLLGKPEDEFMCLVLVLDATQLVLTHNFLIDSLGAEHSYPDYVPHITLSYQVAKDFDCSTLQVPELVFKPERIKFEPLNTNWRSETQ